MVKAIRSFARRHLPENFRQKLGTLLGPVELHVANPLGGLLFDLRGESSARTAACSRFPGT